MGTIANAKVTHYYNCYNGDFIGCLPILHNDSSMLIPFSFRWHKLSNTFCLILLAS